MRQILLTLALVGALLMATTAQAFALESIPSFHSDITINQDTSLTITERVIFQTDEERHGIYRYIPYRYTVNGLNQTTRVNVVSVVDENNRDHEYELSKSDGNITLKIGDPDETFTGAMAYVITYHVGNAIQRYDDHDELYWDITGEGWQFAVENPQATIYSPFAEIERIACYSGTFGSDDGLCEGQLISENLAEFSYPAEITYGENMTIAVGLTRPNALLFPGPVHKAIQFIQDNIGLIVLLIPGSIMLIWWWRKGRDFAFTSPNVFNNDPTQPQFRVGPFNFSRIPMVYEPLKDLTPGEAGALIDESVDNQDVVAEILELARKKYLKIEQTSKKKLLGSETDYVFTQLKPADDKLTEVQKYLQEQLFKKGSTATLSKLRGTFHTTMEKAKKMMYSNLTQRQLFNANPQEAKGRAFAAISIMGFASFYFLLVALQNQLWPGILFFGISIVVGLICAWQISSRTAVGHNLALQAAGLREVINRGKWRQEVQEKHLFIERVFTYAVALGVVQKLARDMEDLNIKPPTYIHGVTNAMVFNSWVSDFNSKATSNLSYNPSSSSRSGGSGFSGGSSGGGGGGGGGGSW